MAVDFPNHHPDSARITSGLGPQELTREKKGATLACVVEQPTDTECRLARVREVLSPFQSSGDKQAICTLLSPY